MSQKLKPIYYRPKNVSFDDIYNKFNIYLLDLTQDK